MSSFDSARPRQAPGTSAGGQFTTKARGEVDIDLAAPGAEHGPLTATARANARELVALWADLGTGKGDLVERYDALESEVYSSLPEVDRSIVADDFLYPMCHALNGGDEEEFEALASKLEMIAEREQAWRAAGYEPPGPAHYEEQGVGPVVYRKTTGAKFTGWRDVASIAKDVRADLKAARKAGYLPEELRISVRSDKFAGGQAIQLQVRGLDDRDIYQPKSHLDLAYERRYTEYATQVRDRVTAIANAYGKSDVSSETDYSNVAYYCHVDLIDEERAALYAGA